MSDDTSFAISDESLKLLRECLEADARAQETFRSVIADTFESYRNQGGDVSTSDARRRAVWALREVLRPFLLEPLGYFDATFPKVADQFVSGVQITDGPLLGPPSETGDLTDGK